METKNLFLLGRPGGGKSEVYRRLCARLKESGAAEEFPRLDDFPKLWGIFQEEEKSGAWRRCRKTPDGGYKVTDDRVWDDILIALNRDVEQLQGKHPVLFVEFARDDYRRALKNFSPEIRRNAAILYVACSFETCWKRNLRRHQQRLAEGTDDHLVSREEMEKTYLTDDEARLEENGLPVFRLDNEEEGEEHLERQIRAIWPDLRRFLGITPAVV